MNTNTKLGLLGLGALLLIGGNASAAAATPKMVDRYGDWSLMRSATSFYNKRSLSQIEQIVIHHVGSTGQTVEDIARYHVLSNGWPGIGYWAEIDRDGLITICNSLENISYHVAGQNTRSVGICVNGNFEGVETPSAEQLQSLSWLIAYLRQTLPNQLPVVGHKDLAPTACPGFNLYPYLQQFNTAV